MLGPWSGRIKLDFTSSLCDWSLLTASWFHVQMLESFDRKSRCHCQRAKCGPPTLLDRRRRGGKHPFQQLWAKDYSGWVAWRSSKHFHWKQKHVNVKNCEKIRFSNFLFFFQKISSHKGLRETERHEEIVFLGLAVNWFREKGSSIPVTSRKRPVKNQHENKNQQKQQRNSEKQLWGGEYSIRGNVTTGEL